MKAITLLIVSMFAMAANAETFAEFARAQRDTLKRSTYATVETTHKLATDEATRAKALAVLEAMGIQKIYLETSRGCPVLPEAELIFLRDFLKGQGYDVAAGIASHPSSPGYGVKANEGLAWFNYQSPKTQADVAETVRQSAKVFDEVIIDDFFCSGDKSEESNAARGAREWGAYRRDLLTGLSQSMVLTPAREANPNVHVIIKYPQWYDLFDVYGYDPERQPQLFDGVYVGTETRGPRTQRFGFTQPYEGFVNFRWLSTLSRGKIGGAWFDFGDCTGPEFVDQAWMSTLAGARELVIFSFPTFLSGHEGLDLLRDDYPKLVDLARAVAAHPATGVAAYKPANSAAGNDIYLLDHLGMLGLPLVPVSEFPSASAVTLLPTQAAADAALLKKITLATKPGKTFIFTPGLLATAPDGEALSRLAGVVWPKQLAPVSAGEFRMPGGDLPVPRGLDLATRLEKTTARVVLEAVVDGQPIPLLTEQEKDGCRTLVLNVRGYGPDDFLATGEYLLSPRELGILDLPAPACNVLRRAIAGVLVGDTQLPARTTLHTLGEAGWFLQNFNTAPVAITVPRALIPGASSSNADTSVQREIPAGGRLWLRADTLEDVSQ